MISIKDEDLKRLKEIESQSFDPYCVLLARKILANIAELMQETPYPPARVAPKRCGHCEDCLGLAVRAVGGYSCREVVK